MTPSDLNLLSSFVRAASEFKLTGHQLTMLTTIAQRPGIALNGICDHTGIQYSPDSYRPMVIKGLVEMRKTKQCRFRTGPRGQNGLHITPDGEAMLARLVESIKSGIKPKQEAA